MNPHFQVYQGKVTTSSDSKKLAPSGGSLAKSDALSSPAKNFFDRFMAKRVRNTSWHHSADSKQDERYAFTYVFRHNVRLPYSESLLVPTLGTLDAIAPYNTVQTAEKNINDLEGGDVPGKTFYSPFCLQELEHLSWNINNFKILPAMLGNSVGALPGSIDLSGEANAALRAQWNVDQFGTSTQIATQQSALAMQLPDVQPLPAGTTAAGQNPSWIASLVGVPGNAFTNPMSLLTNQPYVQETASMKVAGGDMGSYPRKFSKVLNAVDTNVDLGRYKIQIGGGKASFTFVNTGDATMIVDCVVHRPKDKHHLFELGHEKWNTHMLNDGVVDIHQKIVEPYANHYIDYHDRNKDRVMSVFQRKKSDVEIRPDTKFLPTSYRTATRPAQAKNPAAGMFVHDSIGSSGESTSTAEVDIMDIYRHKYIVPANTRKTVTLTMPAKQYDPAEFNYNAVLNELGYAVTFGVTGKTARAIIDPQKVTSPRPHYASRFMGRQAAPTSFHIYGNETQTVYPCFMVEKPDYHANSARLPRLVDENKNLSAATLNMNRVSDGRYTGKLVDAQADHTAIPKKRMPEANNRLAQELEEAQNDIQEEMDTLKKSKRSSADVQSFFAKANDWFKTHKETINAGIKTGVMAYNAYTENLPAVIEGIPGYVQSLAGTAQENFDLPVDKDAQALISDAAVAGVNIYAESSVPVEPLTAIEVKALEAQPEGKRRRLLADPGVSLIGNAGQTSWVNQPVDEERLVRCLEEALSIHPTALTVYDYMFPASIGADGLAMNKWSDGSAMVLPVGKQTYWSVAELVGVDSAGLPVYNNDVEINFRPGHVGSWSAVPINAQSSVGSVGITFTNTEGSVLSGTAVTRGSILDVLDHRLVSLSSLPAYSEFDVSFAGGPMSSGETVPAGTGKVRVAAADIFLYGALVKGTHWSTTEEINLDTQAISAANVDLISSSVPFTNASGSTGNDTLTFPSSYLQPGTSSSVTEAYVKEAIATKLEHFPVTYSHPVDVVVEVVSATYGNYKRTFHFSVNTDFTLNL